MIENISEVSGATYDTLNAPSNTRGTSGNLLFDDASNFWVDDGDSYNKYKTTLDSNYYIFYFVYKNNEPSVYVDSIVKGEI